jgi:hypothetical protein
MDKSYVLLIDYIFWSYQKCAAPRRETLSLSHVLKATIAIQIEGKIACDCPATTTPTAVDISKFLHLLSLWAYRIFIAVKG